MNRDDTAVDSAASGDDVAVEQALQLAGQTLDDWSSLADDEERRVAMEKVQSLLETLQKDQPSNPGIMFLTARMDALTGRALDAIAELRSYLQTREGRTNWRAHKLLGDLYNRDYPQLAKSSYRKALTLKPNEPTVLAGYANCLFRLGRRKQAISMAKESARRQPSAQAYAQLTRMLLGVKNLAEAQQAAEQALAIAIERTGKEPTSRRHLQELDEQYKLLVEVLQARLTEVNPAPDIYANLAHQLRERADVVRQLALFDVLRALEAGMAAAGDHPSALLRERYGIALAEIGRKVEAIKIFQDLLRDHPERQVAKQWLEKLLPDQILEDKSSQG